MTKILVIEDEPTILENIIEILELGNYEGVAAQNGRIGVQLALEHRPDLIICDVMMPELDGYGVLMHLRSEPSMVTTPFIFLTAKSDKEAVRKGMEFGADDYLTKPFTPQELLRSIEIRLARQESITREHSRQLEDLRGNIVHMLPHELRTPLSAIMGYSEFLLEEPDVLAHEDVAAMIGRINVASRRLFHLIENFLVYAQIEILKPKGERILTSMTQSPHQIIAEQAQALALEAQRGADLRLDIAEIPSVQVSLDSLRKICSELIQNAFKFSKPGTPVEVCTIAGNGVYTLLIRDEGRGMTAQQIAEIGAYMQFERKIFEQQGAGLGLSIARGLAELHNGALKIESVPSEYTTVSVSLPVKGELHSG
jgi:two-component system, sensor histidine kinase and response regulator